MGRNRIKKGIIEVNTRLKTWYQKLGFVLRGRHVLRTPVYGGFYGEENMSVYIESIFESFLCAA
jgi:hypothetical protein